MKVVFCVVLYNRHIDQSETINTYSRYASTFLKGTDITIYIHNNGPKALNSRPKLPEGTTYSLYEVLDNLSLSKAYNRCIDTIAADYYVILDQDTELQESFFKALSELIDKKSALMLPRVLDAEGKQKAPWLYSVPNAGKRIMITQCGFVPSKHFARSIGSGIVISKPLVERMKALYGTVFDERFNIYKTDTAFFYRLRDLAPFEIEINGEIKQHMAAAEQESKTSKHFRQTDTAKGWAMQEKFYEGTGFKPFIIKCIHQYIIKSQKPRLFKIALDAYRKNK